MGIITAIQKNHFEIKEKRGWDKTYWFFDIHGTVLKPNYQYGNTPKDFYPYAKETLQLITKLPDIWLIHQILKTWIFTHIFKQLYLSQMII